MLFKSWRKKYFHRKQCTRRREEAPDITNSVSNLPIFVISCTRGKKADNFVKRHLELIHGLFNRLNNVTMKVITLKRLYRRCRHDTQEGYHYRLNVRQIKFSVMKRNLRKIVRTFRNTNGLFYMVTTTENDLEITDVFRILWSFLRTLIFKLSKRRPQNLRG